MFINPVTTAASSGQMLDKNTWKITDWAHTSEWEPANHTSLMSAVHLGWFLPGNLMFSSFVWDAPSCINSGKNLTQRSSRARAWQKTQIWSQQPTTQGSIFFGLRKPTEETVSLGKGSKIKIKIHLGHQGVHTTHQQNAPWHFPLRMSSWKPSFFRHSDHAGHTIETH